MSEKLEIKVIQEKVSIGRTIERTEQGPDNLNRKVWDRYDHHIEYSLPGDSTAEDRKIANREMNDEVRSRLREEIKKSEDMLKSK